MTDGRLSGDVAIVTGGASGIGRAIAHRFAAEGARVVIGDVDAEGGAAVRDDIRETGGTAAFVRTDIAEADDVDGLFEAANADYGTPTVLINNAGAVIDDGNLHEVDESAWERNVDVNLTGHYRCAKRAVSGMVDAGGRQHRHHVVDQRADRPRTDVLLGREGRSPPDDEADR